MVLIELQGDTEAKVASERNGKLVGTLSVDEKLQTHTTDGHHLLERKIQNVNKPLAVLHRLPAPSNSSSITFTATSISTSGSASSRSRSTQPPIPQRRGDEGGMDDGMPEESYTEPSTGPETLETQNDEESQRQGMLTESAEPNPWMIMGVVEKKIIFSKRPIPIVEMKASSGNLGVECNYISMQV